jgi:hypothetical protein
MGALRELVGSAVSGLILAAFMFLGWLVIAYPFGNSRPLRWAGFGVGLIPGYVASRYFKKYWEERGRRPACVRIGEIAVVSEKLKFQDATLLYAAASLELPNGRYPLWAEIVDCPGLGKRIAKIRLVVQAGNPESRVCLGKFSIDSATAIVADAATIDRHWQSTGSKRIGQLAHPDHRKYAKLVEQQFGLRSRPVDMVVSEFDRPVDPELETRIREFLNTMPECGASSFSIKSGSTLDEILKAMSSCLHSEISLAKGPEARLIAFQTGLGDGEYTLEAGYRGGQLVCAEVSFLGEEQAPILAQFARAKELAETLDIRLER